MMRPIPGWLIVFLRGAMISNSQDYRPYLGYGIDPLLYLWDDHPRMGSDPSGDLTEKW